MSQCAAPSLQTVLQQHEPRACAEESRFCEELLEKYADIICPRDTLDGGTLLSAPVRKYPSTPF